MPEQKFVKLAIEQLFDGGPDTPCHTTWPTDGAGGKIECVEVPIDDLREALEQTAKQFRELQAERDELYSIADEAGLA